VIGRAHSSTTRRSRAHPTPSGESGSTDPRGCVTSALRAGERSRAIHQFAALFLRRQNAAPQLLAPSHVPRLPKTLSVTTPILTRRTPSAQILDPIVPRGRRARSRSGAIAAAEQGHQRRRAPTTTRSSFSSGLALARMRHRRCDRAWKSRLKKSAAARRPPAPRSLVDHSARAAQTQRSPKAPLAAALPISSGHKGGRLNCRRAGATREPAATAAGPVDRAPGDAGGRPRRGGVLVVFPVEALTSTISQRAAVRSERLRQRRRSRGWAVVPGRRSCGRCPQRAQTCPGGAIDPQPRPAPGRRDITQPPAARC
jgi:hypothetical protein